MFKKSFLTGFAVMTVMMLITVVKADKTILLDVKNVKQVSAWRLDGSNTGREAQVVDGAVKVTLGKTLGRKWAAYKLSTGRLFNAKSAFINLKFKNLGQAAKINLMLFDRNKRIWIKTIELEGNDWTDLKLPLNAGTFKCKKAKNAKLPVKDIILLQFSVFNQPMVSFAIKEICVTSK